MSSIPILHNISFEGAAHHRVLIIGAGPAGYTAALYAARANLAPVVYTGLEPGGQLTTTTDVENYPGYVDGVLGPAMMEDFKAQAVRFGAEVEYGEVTHLDLSQRPMKVVVDDETGVLADTVIVATGRLSPLSGFGKRKTSAGAWSICVCNL